MFEKQSVTQVGFEACSKRNPGEIVRLDLIRQSS